MPDHLADFDSATAMVIATARCLSGKDFAALGQQRYLQHLVRFSEVLPERPRRALYAALTGLEAVSHESMGKVRAENIAQWMADLYPTRSYPAIFLGSSGGALCHLAAALDAPWLPQTFLIPLRRKGGGVDDPKGDLEQAREAGLKLLAENPELRLHQMHDPNQDRLSLQYITYFRVKFRTMPAAYRRFLLERVMPGGTVVVADCGIKWPTTRIDDRYLFQFGAVGGMQPEEMHAGSERVADMLARYGASIRNWDPPAPDGESPEAEWGYDAELDRDVEAVARERGLRVVRLSYDMPDDISAPVADFYRDWYRERGIPADRLLAESFVLVEPYLALRAGLVPFWMVFNTQSSLDSLLDYLEQTEPYDRSLTMLFSHGTESVGLPSIEDWRRPFDHARSGGEFVGVNEKAFPSHFSALARYHLDLRRLPERYDPPDPLPFERFQEFLEARQGRYPVRLSG